jgi:hypothetical protein
MDNAYLADVLRSLGIDQRMATAPGGGDMFTFAPVGGAIQPMDGVNAIFAQGRIGANLPMGEGTLSLGVTPGYEASMVNVPGFNEFKQRGKLAGADVGYSTNGMNFGAEYRNQPLPNSRKNEQLFMLRFGSEF